ncbi:gamma carbonic anhydrase family protein [archaeon SCG-AAA382B04]|nr:gamma carbonic anhydrase family protein [archaeon SCG-AAA382B04]
MKKNSSCYIAESAKLLGNVEIGKKSSVWPNATIRADSIIKIGEKTNIQDNCVLHSQGKEKTNVGDEVTIGHGAIVHSAKVKDQSLIGINSTILNDAEIGENSIIGASALVTENQKIPSQSVVMGVPGEIVRRTTKEEIEKIKERANKYVELAQKYKKTNKKH